MEEFVHEVNFNSDYEPYYIENYTPAQLTTCLSTQGDHLIAQPGSIVINEA
jgi:hypothetical protein